MTELMLRDVLEFVYEEVRVPGRFRERTYTKLLEERILDEAGSCVGLVSEEPPLSNSTFELGGHLARPVRASLHAFDGRRVLEFSASHGARRFLGRSLEWGRRLDVADDAGEPVGTLLAGEFKRRGTLYGRSGEPIGTLKASRRSFHHVILDESGKEVGRIGDSRVARSAPGPAVSRRTRIKEWCTTKGIPKHHFLVANGDVDPDLRMMMLATSAALHLVLTHWAWPKE